MPREDTACTTARWVRSNEGAWYGLLGRLELHDGAGTRSVTLDQILVPGAVLSPSRLALVDVLDAATDDDPELGFGTDEA